MYLSLFYLKLNVNLRYKCAYEIALIFLTFPNSLENLRDTAEEIEIEMKEVKETLSSLTTTVEKSTDKGWLL